MTAQTTLCVLLLAVSPGMGLAQNSPPDAPPELRPPAETQLVLHASAKGDQIYTCKQDAGQYAWALKAPAAQLFDAQGNDIGHHFGGPTWELKDGSAVVGKVAARADSPDKDSVPWLLLTAADHSGSGLMAGVTHIQRLNTKGGKAPAAGCDASHAGQETRVAYSADYYFYGTRIEH